MPIKPRLKRIAIRGFEATGRYKPFVASELECVPVEVVEFAGDLPRSAGNENSQGRLEYKLPRLPQEVNDLLYTPGGMAWMDGALHRKFSLGEPSVRDLFKSPFGKPAVILPEGVVVQAETPYTYGDWISEHVCTIAAAMPLAAPLLMPVHLMAKSCVRRDLGLLGIETHTVESTVLIRKALVLPKKRFSHYFTRDEVQAFRRVFHVDSEPPRSGSILYLSREGERGR